MSKRSPSPSFEDRKKVKKSYLQEELNRYKTKGSTKKGKGKKGGDEMDVMAALNSFRAKLNADSEDVDMDAGAAEGEEEWDRDTASFMKHELKIEDDGNREEMDKAQNDYEVLGSFKFTPFSVHSLTRLSLQTLLQAHRIAQQHSGPWMSMFGKTL